MAARPPKVPPNRYRSIEHNRGMNCRPIRMWCGSRHDGDGGNKQTMWQVVVVVDWMISRFHTSLVLPPTMSNRMAIKRLLQEFREMSSLPDGIVAGPISPDNLFEWECMLLGPPGTPYDAGCFRAKVSFPPDYPFSPPTMKFTSQIWHPNVFPNGTVCISILHNPSDPMYSTYEHPSEQWSPVQSLEKILLSVLSLFSEPNANSPANIDAAKQWREDRAGFQRKVDDMVRQSLGFS